jgi:hypothetical protein
VAYTRDARSFNPVTGREVKLSTAFHEYGDAFFGTQMNAGKRAWSQTPLHVMPRFETWQGRLTPGSARNSAEADMLRARLHTDLSRRIGVYLCSSAASPKIYQRIYENVSFIKIAVSRTNFRIICDSEAGAGIRTGCQKLPQRKRRGPLLRAALLMRSEGNLRRILAPPVKLRRRHEHRTYSVSGLA